MQTTVLNFISSFSFLFLGFVQYCSKGNNSFVEFIFLLLDLFVINMFLERMNFGIIFNFN